MSPVLVDSNVILDVATEDEQWMEWSADALARCGESSLLVINPLIHAEVLPHCRSGEHQRGRP